MLGPGLAFVTYPEVVTRLPLAPFWAIIFFVMLITLGLDSEFVTMETVITAIVDHMPRLLPYKMWVTLGICITWFFIGLSMTARGGVYVLELISNYAAGWSLMIIAFLEILIVCCLYGIRTFSKNIATMIGYNPLHYWWVANWCCITPALLLSILFWTLYSHAPLTYGDYVYPEWANGIGWLLAIMPLVPLPVGVIYALIHNKGMSWRLLKSTDGWAPAHKLAKRTTSSSSPRASSAEVTSGKVASGRSGAGAGGGSESHASSAVPLTAGRV